MKNMFAVARIAIVSALASGLLASLTLPQAAAATPFNSLAGSWSGGGRADFEGGQSESLRCTAYYRALDQGNRLGLSIRCASASAKVDLRADLVYNGGRVSGSWEERTFNAGGMASGSATNSGVRLAFSGPIQGSMSVSLGKSSQNVSIRSSGSALRAVSMSLSRK